MTLHPAIELDRQALRDNVQVAKQMLGSDVALMFAVKANAYGHGMDLVAPAVIADGADELAVLDIPTGVAARSFAPHTPLLAWLFGPEDDVDAAADHGLELGVSTLEQLDAIGATRGNNPVVVHLKIDTGLSRNGATAANWPALVAAAHTLETAGRIRVRAVWSHLADTSAEASRRSLSRLHEAHQIATDAGLTPDTLHLAASHAAVDLPEARLDLVRFGILGYGVSPFDDRQAQDLGFHPVLTLCAPLVDVSDHTLTLGVGFGHGLLPPHSPEASLTIAGRPFAISRVDAQETVVTGTTDGLDVAIGDQVPVLGAAPGAPSVEQWARWSHTIGDEVLVRLREDIPRRFVGE